jgi:hypothetical protein
MSKDLDYDAIYRKANPRTMPYNIHCRQPELSDLWPIDQQKFKRIVDAALRAQEALGFEIREKGQ